MLELTEVEIGSSELPCNGLYDNDDRGDRVSYPYLSLEGISEGTVVMLKNLAARTYLPQESEEQSEEQGESAEESREKPIIKKLMPLFYEYKGRMVHVFDTDLSLDFVLSLSRFQNARLISHIAEGVEREINIKDAATLSRLMTVF